MNKARIIVDRIENGLAVCEVNGALVDIPLANISGAVREGDILNENDSFYTIAKEETEERRVAITSRFERLKSKNKQQ